MSLYAEGVSGIGNGEFIVVLDSPSRENEGDLIIAASAITTEKMAFMIRHTSGLICAPLPTSRADALDLPYMVEPSASTDVHGTAYTVSIDSSDPSTTTGISSHDRALTCRTLADLKARSASFRRPGHVFPLRARDGGIRSRKGHTEAAVEFCRLARMGEVGVICELVDDGEPSVQMNGHGPVAPRAERVDSGMLRTAGCLAFGKKWGLKVCTIEALVEYVERTEGSSPHLNGKA